MYCALCFAGRLLFERTVYKYNFFHVSFTLCLMRDSFYLSLFVINYLLLLLNSHSRAAIPIIDPRYRSTKAVAKSN
jgi:hypothetical protein